LSTRRLPRNEPDYVLIMTAITLVAIGLLMVYSASYLWAVQTARGPAYYFLRQCVWAALGVAAALIMYKIDFQRWRRWAIPILMAALLALLVILVAGENRYGALITLFRGSIQPNEVAKIAIIIYLATWLSSKGDKVQNISYGLLPFGVLLGLVTGLIALQPDLGAAIVIVCIALAMFFLAGADAKQVALSLAVGALTFGAMLYTSETARTRVTDFIQLVRDPQAGGHPHVRLALQALASGGIGGTGFPDSVYKDIGGVPLPFSDSIFPILGEEMGLVGTWLVLGLFGMLAYRGFRIASRAEGSYAMLLASGLTSWFVIQALINIAVNTALAPYTGITLPFISQGGSSLVACLAGMGLLANISQNGNGRQEAGALRESFDVGRGDWGTRLPDSRRAGGSGRQHGARVRSSRARTRRQRLFGLFGGPRPGRN